MEGNTEESSEVNNEEEVLSHENYDEESDYEDDSYSESEEPLDGSEDYDYDDSWEAQAGGSEPTPLGGLYGLFKEVAKQPDTKRVSNLTDAELGVWNLTVRDCERIALIAETFNHKGVAKFFRKQSRIITDTAMSKKGWFTELFITSKKFASHDSSSSIQNLPQFSSSKKKSKWRVFSDTGPPQDSGMN